MAYLVEFGDGAGLSTAVSSYLQRPELAFVHGQEGMKTDHERYCVAAMVQSTLGKYRELLAKDFS